MVAQFFPPIFDRLLDQVHAVAEGDFIMLDRRTVSPPPVQIEVRDMIIHKGFHDYGSFRIDHLNVHAHPRILGHIGLLVLADVLHPSDTGVELRLAHPRSVIKRWRLRVGSRESLGLNQRPVSFGYAPEQPEYHPWTNEHHAVRPFFALTNAAECVISEQERTGRDVVVGCGGPEASARFAALLLDLSRPGNTCIEVALEGEAGFRSLAPASAELTFWLPGSIGWEGNDAPHVPAHL